jgi:hypothetical protein
MDALINAVESTENTVDQSHFYEEEENDVIEVCNTVDVDMSILLVAGLM